MKLENVVPWGRNFEEYVAMFLLSDDDFTGKILGCGDGPASVNSELNKNEVDIISIDPIYQFSKDEIKGQIDKTSSIVSKQLRDNQNDFVWNNIVSVDDLIDIRLSAMSEFLNDYELGKQDRRYIYGELPNLAFEDNSFELVWSSHFLFLYSEHFDLEFHKKSILEMCRVSKKEVRIFPLLDLNNERSEFLDPIINFLNSSGFNTEVIKSNYEFQKGANEMLVIKK